MKEQNENISKPELITAENELPYEAIDNGSTQDIEEYADPFAYDPDGSKKRAYDAAHGYAAALEVDNKAEKRKSFLLYAYGAIVGILIQPILWQSYKQFFRDVLPLAPQFSEVLFYGLGVLAVLLMIFLLIRKATSVTSTDNDHIKFRPLALYIPFTLLLMVSLYVPGKIVPVIAMSLSLIPLILLFAKGNMFARKFFGPLMAVLFIITLSANTYAKLLEKNVSYESRCFVISTRKHDADKPGCKFIYCEEKLQDYLVMSSILTSDTDFIYGLEKYYWEPSGHSIVSLKNYSINRENVLGKAVYEVITGSGTKYDKKFFEKYDLLVGVSYCDGYVSDVKLGEMKENHGIARVKTEIQFEPADEATSELYDDNTSGPDETMNDPNEEYDDIQEDIILVLFKVSKNTVPGNTLVYLD